MRTDPAQYPGEGKLSLDHLQGILISSLSSEGNITLGIYTCRACQYTRGSLCLFDGIDIRNRLGIGNVSGFPLGQASLIFAGELHRTNARTLSTTGTLRRIDISRAFFDAHPISTRLTFYRQDVGIRQDLYIQMATKLHELGGEDSHGTIVGRKGLIQLSHDAPDARSFLHHVDEIT
jgi:hypothetical protein